MDSLKTIAEWQSPKIWLALIVYVALWFGLGATRLWDRDEPRNARCAVEMLERNDWIVPMFNGELRTHKPILLYWLQMPSIAILGPTDFAARLGSAFMATLTVVALYLFAKKTINSDVGFWSAAVLASSFMFVIAARAATPDACLIATSTIGILSIAFHWKTHVDGRAWFAILGYLSLGMAVLAKGPVGYVLPMMVLGVWAFLQGWHEIQVASPAMQWLRRSWLVSWMTFRRLQILEGTCITLAIAVPWYLCVGVRTNGEWLRGFFLDHNLGRAMNSMEGHRGGWWFYPAASLVGLFPWSMLLIPIALWTGKRLRHSVNSPILQLGLIWMCVYVFIFSLAKTKLPSYITPGYPGAALCIGGFVAEWCRNRELVSRAWLSIGAFVFGSVGVCIAGGLYYVSIQHALPKLSWQGVWASGFVGIAIAMVWNARRLATSKPVANLTYGILAAAVLFLGGMFGIASPTVGSYRNDVDAIMALDQDFAKTSPDLTSTWCSVRTIEPSWVFYLENTIKELAFDDRLGLSEKERVIKQVVKTLASKNGRVIIDGRDINKWKERLRPYGLDVVSVAEFRTFLKNESVAVLSQVHPELARRSERSVSIKTR
jgi:4-amino-4-deoxy-L-arabinose transferase-like glycosyltransferase